MKLAPAQHLSTCVTSFPFLSLFCDVAGSGHVEKGSQRPVPGGHCQRQEPAVGVERPGGDGPEDKRAVSPRRSRARTTGEQRCDGNADGIISADRFPWKQKTFLVCLEPGSRVWCGAAVAVFVRRVGSPPGVHAIGGASPPLPLPWETSMFFEACVHK